MNQEEQAIYSKGYEECYRLSLAEIDIEIRRFEKWGLLKFIFHSELVTLKDLKRKLVLRK